MWVFKKCFCNRLLILFFPGHKQWVDTPGPSRGNKGGHRTSDIRLGWYDLFPRRRFQCDAIPVTMVALRQQVYP